jgi:hypothetical protein
MYERGKSEKSTSAENKVAEASENILSNLTSADLVQNDHLIMEVYKVLYTPYVLYNPNG